MARRVDERTRIEFGDFQTPPALAEDICHVLLKSGVDPRSIVEPTCGVGNFLLAAISAFPNARCVFGTDINQGYVDRAQQRVRELGGDRQATVEAASIFEPAWSSRLVNLSEPILVVGNPPWVTSSDLGYLNCHNIPEKVNFHGRAGLDALTGKSNFDISEWMLIKLLSWLDGRRASLAMLCKTAVARKVLLYGWRNAFRIESASIYRIDSARHFNAAVDACLFRCNLGTATPSWSCAVFASLDAREADSTLAYRDGTSIADAEKYDRWKFLIGSSDVRSWRSGVKHDCAAVMELRTTPHGYQNGDGEILQLEDRFVYPMLKSSELAREGSLVPSKWMIITQSYIGEDTSAIQACAPHTWAYLTKHSNRFAKRGSSIYKGKPAFSIFGVGAYTFAPWKVAISGLYKKLTFRVVGPSHGKPVVLDDTCYFTPCASEAEARLIAEMLSSPVAVEFFTAFVFWDSKRPITADLLRRLDLRRLARELGREGEYDRLTRYTASLLGLEAEAQLGLFEVAP